jgi:hypothetical protein
MGAGNGQRSAERSGRRALFSDLDGPAPSRDPRPRARRSGRSGAEGRQALFSAAPRADGTVLVECSACQSRTPVPVTGVWRHLVPSVWVPVRDAFPVWMHCPSCGRRTWCGLNWSAVVRGVRRR